MYHASASNKLKHTTPPTLFTLLRALSSCSCTLTVFSLLQNTILADIATTTHDDPHKLKRTVAHLEAHSSTGMPTVAKQRLVASSVKNGRLRLRVFVLYSVHVN